MRRAMWSAVFGFSSRGAFYHFQKINESAGGGDVQVHQHMNEKILLTLENSHGTLHLVDFFE